jgi:hypothetical protein
MKSTILIATIALLSYGFISITPISKKEVKDNIEVYVQVSKNQKGKNRFFGLIEIKNKTNKKIIFNFNQNLIIGTDTLTPKYNFRPISYAPEAFMISHNETKTWSVVWEYKGEQRLNNKINILIDTSISEQKTVEEIIKTD